MKTRLAGLAVATLLSLAACGSDETDPTPEQDAQANECTGSVSYHAGSTPPPTSYEWELIVKDDDSARFVFEAAHVDEDPLYATDLQVTDEQRQALCEAVADVPEEEDLSTGGSTLYWDLTGAKNATSNQEYYPDILDAVHDILGDHYDQAYAEFEQWRDNY